MNDFNQLQYERFFQILKNLSDIVCISDFHTGEILFANQNFIELIGRDPTGEKCYRSLFGSDDFCPFCNREIIELDDILIQSQEIESSFLKKFFLVTVQVSNWLDGRKVHFVIAKDITRIKNKEKDFEAINNELLIRNCELKNLNDNLSKEHAEILNLKDQVQEKNSVLQKTNLLLRNSEEKYKRITDNISDVVWTTDLNFRTTFVSPSVTKLLGESVEKHLQRSMEEKFSLDSIQKINDILSEEMDNENKPDSDPDRFRTIETEHIKADGSSIFVEIRVSFIRDDKGKPIGFQGITRDIGERKRIEIEQNKLLKQNKILADLRKELFLIENSSQVFEILVQKISELLEPAFVFICSYNEIQKSLHFETSYGAESMANEFLNTFNIKLNEINISLTEGNESGLLILKGDRIERVTTSSLFSGLEDQNISHYLHSHFLHTGGINLKNRFYGSIFILSTKNISDQITLIADMIQRGLLQLQNLYDHYALKLSEEKFSKTFHNSPDVIIISTVEEGRVIDVNDSITRLTGYEKEELIGKSANDLHFWDIEGHRDQYTEMLALTGKVYDFETKFRKKNGDTFFAIISGELIRMNENIYIVSIIHDISKRKLIELDLFESKSRLERTFENIPDVIVLYDTNLRIKYINSATQKITGYTQNYFLGKRDDELWDTAVSLRITELLERTLHKKIKQTISDFFDLPNGRFYLNITCLPLLDENMNVYEIIGITHDLTEEMGLINQIHESEQKFHNFFDYNQAVMLEIDILTRKVINCNKKAIEYYGYSKDVFLEKTVYDLNPTDKNLLDSLIDQVALKTNSKITTKHQLFNDEIKDVEILISTFNVNNEKHNFIIVNDITEQKKIEFELEQYQKNLEDTVKKRTLELEEKNQELEKFNELFVGREFRIKELKNKILKLENIISTFNETKE